MEIITSIKTIKDWKRVYPPAGKDKQWKDGYSAKEFAKIVLDAYPNCNFENDLARALHIPNLKIIPEETYPERLTNFDDNYRGPRHHDLACIAKDGNKNIALCFEAKVNESLDKTLIKYRDSEGKIQRVDKLISNFFNCSYSEKFSNIYYQIFSAVAGSIAFAAENNVDDVYFILYQIKPNSINQLNNKSNHLKALNDFISLFNVPLITKEKNIANLGQLKIERHFEDEQSNEKMYANVRIAYIEKDVTGKKINEI